MATSRDGSSTFDRVDVTDRRWEESDQWRRAIDVLGRSRETCLGVVNLISSRDASDSAPAADLGAVRVLLAARRALGPHSISIHVGSVAENGPAPLGPYAGLKSHASKAALDSGVT